MNVLAFRIVTSTSDLLVFEDPPYVLPAVIAILSGLFLAISVCILHWRSTFARSRLTFLLIGSLVCVLLGVWLAGLQYRFVISRRPSTIEIRKSWFGHPVSFESFSYNKPPIASVVTTKNTTHQLVLTFDDGRIKTLGLSTDRKGHDELAALLNRFFQNRSGIKQPVN